MDVQGIQGGLPVQPLVNQDPPPPPPPAEPPPPAQPPIWLGFPQKVFADTGALSNLLKLVQRISDLAAAILASSPIANVAAAFKTVTDFISARNFVGRVADLSAIGTHTFFWVANKVVSLIGDIGSTVGWLAGIKVFGDATSKEILEKSWWSVQGKSVTFLDEVGKYSCVSSAVLDIVDVFQWTVDQIRGNTPFRNQNGNGEYRARDMGTRVCSVLGDAARISFVFLKTFGYASGYVAGAGIAAETASLASFYIKNYWREHDRLPWVDGAVALVNVAADRIGRVVTGAVTQMDRAVTWIRNELPPWPHAAAAPVVV